MAKADAAGKVLVGLISALAAGAAVSGEIKRAKEDDTLSIRAILEEGSFRVHELLTPETVREAGVLLDLPLQDWAKWTGRGLHRIFVIADLDSDRGAVFVAHKAGAAWDLNMAFGPSGATIHPDLLAGIYGALRYLSASEQARNPTVRKARADRKRTRGEHFGQAAPAIALGAEALVDVMASIGATAYFARMLLRDEGAMAWLTGYAPDVWSEESEAWKTGLDNVQKKLSEAGLKIGRDCAWMLSPHTIFMKFVQLVADVKIAGGPGVGEMTFRNVARKEIDVAASSAVRRLGAEIKRSPLVGRSPTFQILAETIFLIGFFIGDFSSKVAYVEAVTAEASASLAQNMSTCLGFLKKDWPKEIVRKFGLFFSILFRLLLFLPKIALKGTGPLTLGIVVGMIVSEINKFLTDHGIDIVDLDSAWAFFFPEISKRGPEDRPIAPEVGSPSRPVPQRSSPVPEPTSQESAVAPDEARWKAEGAEAYLEPEVAPGVQFYPGSIPVGIFGVWARRGGSDYVQIGKVSASAARKYILRCDGQKCVWTETS